MRLLLCAILFLFALACTQNKSGSSIGQREESDSMVSDTLPAESQESVMLPDTALPSAGLVRFVVQQLIDSVDGEVCSLKNLYQETDGVLAFRNGPARQADFGARVQGTPDSIAVDWTFTTDFDTCKTKFGVWGGGTGWTGQPLYVKWNAQQAARIAGLPVATADFGCEEIIFGSLCGKVYFLNFATGMPSRQSVDVGNPIKGTVSLDPVFRKNLYVGQGVPKGDTFGNMLVDIEKGEIARLFDRDRNAYRGWGAYDSSPIRVGQFLFWASENGSIYKYLCSDGSMTLHSVMRYTCGGMAPGMESSLCVYRNYGYVADNHGNVICLNLNTLRPVWCHKNGDDTDATIVLSEEGDSVYIYTGCEVDRSDRGMAYFSKLNALNGQLVWQTAMPGMKAEAFGKFFDGGYYATPLLGSGNCSNLVFAHCVTNSDGRNGEFLAFDKVTGKIAYSIKMRRYAWSSPVALLNERDEMFVFTADTNGNVYLINGADGRVLYTRNVGENFESSPVAVGNKIVVGSRGRKIYKMSII